MIDIKKELDKSQTILLTMGGEKYVEYMVDIAKKLSKSTVCYVTLNKTHDSLVELFKKNKVNIDNVVFIDAISKTLKKVDDQTDGCYFVDNPGALTELSLAIDKFLRHSFDYLIFDSLTNLMIYAKKAPVAKFLSTIINKVGSSSTKAVFYAVEIEEQQALLNEVEMFVDKVIKL